MEEEEEDEGEEESNSIILKEEVQLAVADAVQSQWILVDEDT